MPSLDEFVSECRAALRVDPGPGGRERVRELVELALKDEAFVAEHVGDDVPERKVLYEDAELGFTVLVHRYTNANESKPHDHGPSWAIYGQASGETEMTSWEKVAAPADGAPGKARATGKTTLRPGMAFVYNEGVLHSPKRYGPTSLIRIEGQNMDRVSRDRYEVVS